MGALEASRANSASEIWRSASRRTASAEPVPSANYATDIDKLRSVLVDVIDTHPGILHDEAHHRAFQLDDCGDSAIKVRAIFWVARLSD